MQTVWTFISEHYGVISAAASLATLIVWICYLQLFYRSYRRQLQPKILITRGGGHSIGARCILTNMSPEIIYIQAVIVRLREDETELLCSLSDVDKWPREGMDKRSEFFQGPLRSGEFLDLGSFEELAVAAMQNCDGAGTLEGVQDFSVTAVGTYTWHDRLAAAERSFTLTREAGQTMLHAEDHAARQIRSRRELKRIGRLLEEQSSRSVIRSQQAAPA